MKLIPLDYKHRQKRIKSKRSQLHCSSLVKSSDTKTGHSYGSTSSSCSYRTCYALVFSDDKPSGISDCNFNLYDSIRGTNYELPNSDRLHSSRTGCAFNSNSSRSFPAVCFSLAEF
jgi:hypothetical protein